MVYIQIKSGFSIGQADSVFAFEMIIQKLSDQIMYSLVAIICQQLKILIIKSMIFTRQCLQESILIIAFNNNLTFYSIGDSTSRFDHTESIGEYEYIFWNFKVEDSIIICKAQYRKLTSDYILILHFSIAKQIVIFKEIINKNDVNFVNYQVLQYFRINGIPLRNQLDRQDKYMDNIIRATILRSFIQIDANELDNVYLLPIENGYSVPIEQISLLKLQPYIIGVYYGNTCKALIQSIRPRIRILRKQVCYEEIRKFSSHQLIIIDSFGGKNLLYDIRTGKSIQLNKSPHNVYLSGRIMIEKEVNLENIYKTLIISKFTII